uniref:Uncharacterized protein n=1 Tax=Neogobius melanostomus TaxID=47308 RepID=A0A8C6T6K9_9GOBI
QIQPLPQPASVTLQAAPPSAPPPASPDAVVAEDDPKMSVVEMVAFLEQRVTCSPHAKLRSSASITLSRAPPPPSTLSPAPAAPPDPRPIEEPESLSVSDMVAKLEKLETRCLRRRGHGERRVVGRVLLAEQQPIKAPPPPRSSQWKPGGARSPSIMFVSLAQLSNASQTRDSTETPAVSLHVAKSSPDVASAARVGVEAGDASKLSLTPQNSTLSSPKPEKPSPHEEPLPGLLFLTPPPKPCVQSEQRTPVSPAPRRETADSFVVLSLDLPVQSPMRRRRPPSPSPAPSSPPGQSEKRRRQLREDNPAAVTDGLLWPRSKCSCRYLRLIIDTYDPRPLWDALWVCDPRYRDDPCKQCKRRHRRGDVSLCRWHHKPFCQAMPYGPGYWMCCHGDRRDAPGCNVGLHDNRWVPAFHSIDAPLQRAQEESQD